MALPQPQRCGCWSGQSCRAYGFNRGLSGPPVGAGFPVRSSPRRIVRGARMCRNPRSGELRNASLTLDGCGFPVDRKWSSSASTMTGSCRDDVRWGLSVVGVAGFEPATPSSRTRCATRLRYTPKAGLIALAFRGCKFEGGRSNYLAEPVSAGANFPAAALHTLSC